MNIANWVEEAYTRIKPYVRKTPLEYSSYLSELTGAEVYLKLENYQITGSFKIRGAINKVLSLSKEELAKGIIAASTGNHAAATAHAVDITGARATIYMPENVSEVKIKNLARYKGVELVVGGKDCVDSEHDALDASIKNLQTYISPYNDQEVVGGQGTIAIEILEEVKEPEAILIPVGGGGLISGIAGYIKDKTPQTQIIGCQPENSAVMYHSIKAGRVLDMESQPTVSDGTAGGMEEDSITFPICQQYVDSFHLVSESEILLALKILLEQHYMLAEGAAGLSVASLIKNKDDYKGKKVVLIICGNKMSSALLHQVLNT